MSALTCFKSSWNVLVIATLATAALSQLARADSDSDPALNNAYGGLSKAYNQYFDSLMTVPNKTAAAPGLASQIIAPAQSSVVHAMWDNSKEAFEKEGLAVTSAPLSAKDNEARKKLPEMGKIPPIKGTENLGLEKGSGSKLPLAEIEALSDSDRNAKASPGEPVVVDGSQFPRELSFPGAPKTPARKPASLAK